MFYLAYHLHWSPGDVLGLDVAERRSYIALLAARIDEENAAQAALRDGLPPR